jgi:hypothetical protein
MSAAWGSKGTVRERWRRRLLLVMPGLVPGIHVFLFRRTEDVDGRDKPGHDNGKRRNYSFSRHDMSELLEAIRPRK